MLFLNSCTKRLLAVLLIATTLTACGSSKKKNSSNERENEKPPGPILKLTPQPLELSSGSDVNKPNKFLALDAGNKKIHAEFSFNRDNYYLLRLTRLTQDIEGCKGPEPTPILTWSEEGSSSLTPIKIGSTFTAEKSKFYTLAVDVDNSSECSKIELSLIIIGEVQQATGVTLDWEVIIREFTTFNGQPDRASLLIIVPSKGKFEALTIKGDPQGTKPFQASLDKILTGKYSKFMQSAYPMADAERNAILKKYEETNAIGIYTENYDVPLCDNSLRPKEITITGKLLERDKSVLIKFSAKASARDTCQMTYIEKTNLTSVFAQRQ